MQNTITVNVDLGGGLNYVFDGKTQIKLQLPIHSTVDTVIKELSYKHANNKRDMFAVNDIIRPGILVLVNDSDWELSQKEQTKLDDKDRVSIISTLHGG